MKKIAFGTDGWRAIIAKEYIMYALPALSNKLTMLLSLGYLLFQLGRRR